VRITESDLQAFIESARVEGSSRRKVSGRVS
jgi:hypothetical protein